LSAFLKWGCETAMSGCTHFQQIAVITMDSSRVEAVV